MISDKARRALRRIGVRLIAAAMVIAGVTLIADLTLTPIIKKVNTYECHAAVSDIINKAVTAELERENADYSSMVKLVRDEHGAVCSVETRTMTINRLKTGISERIERELDRMSDIKVMIPVGNLTGLTLLHGKGFDVGMTVSPVGYAKTSIISQFEEAGINQTLHRIIVEISVVTDAVIPGVSARVPVSTSITAAETVIVGAVPDAYTHVISSDKELVGELEDYGAAAD